MDSPYTVVIDGLPVKCESAEAALALVRLYGGGTMPPSQPGATSHRGTSANGTRWTDQRVAAFYKLIEGNQRKLIDVLLETEDSRTDAQLLQKLGLSSGMALAGVFTGLFKNAKKVGADPRELYAKKEINIGDKRGFEYTLHDGFRKAASRRAK